MRLWSAECVPPVRRPAQASLLRSKPKGISSLGAMRCAAGERGLLILVVLGELFWWE